MTINVYSRVRYVGPDVPVEGLKTGDIGYVIEDYGDGNYEIEFSKSDGTTRAQVVISQAFVVPVDQ